MLELAILGLLKERPMHGYEIRKSLREDFGVLSNLSFGSLYPALARLESAGALSTLEPSPPARRRRRAETLPMTGSLAGERAAVVARLSLGEAAAAFGARSTRARKVYAITPRGEQLFEELLESNDGSSEDPKGFSLRLAFARHLSPQARVRLLERRHNQLTDRLQRSERALARPGRSMDDYERSLAEHAKETVAADLAWVERLLDHERHLSEHLEPARSPTARESHPSRRVHKEPSPVGAASGADTNKGERPDR